MDENNNKKPPTKLNKHRKSSKKTRQKQLKVKKQANKKKPYNSVVMNTPIDYMTLFIVLFLVAFGILMVYSSSLYASVSTNNLQPYIKQGVFALVGFIVMYIISKFQLIFIRKFIAPVYLIINILLIVVMISAEEIGGAKRWIDLGFVNFQPSEAVKFILILVVAALLTRLKENIEKPRAILLMLVIIGVPIGLVGKEDLSSAIIIMAIVGSMIFLAYKKILRLMAIALPMVIAVVVFIFTAGYRIDRFTAFFDPWALAESTGRQTIQSLYAIGSGGLTGIGLGQSVQKLGYISEAHNDIIFAIICEELGLIGGVAIIGLYAVLIYRMTQVVFAAKSMEHFLIGVGVMSHIAFQGFVNIAVAINLIPTTGVALPFISYGGSSMVVLLAEVGLVLNVARHNYIEEMIGEENL